MKDSSIPKFYEKSKKERLNIVKNFSSLSDEEIELIERLTPLEPLAFKALEQGLKDQDFRFVQLYYNYYAGKPRETKDITINEDQPLFID